MYSQANQNVQNNHDLLVSLVVQEAQFHLESPDDPIVGTQRNTQKSYVTQNQIAQINSNKTNDLGITMTFRNVLVHSQYRTLVL